jgi:hypothetical protein
VLLQIRYDDLCKLVGQIFPFSGRTRDAGWHGRGEVVVLEEVVDDKGIMDSSGDQGAR